LLGGKVETVQKMDKRNFTRVADKKHSAGFYVNIIFEGRPALVEQLKHRFAMNTDVFRTLFTSSPVIAPVATPKPA
jgi:ribosomal protein S6